MNVETSYYGVSVAGESRLVLWHLGSGEPRLAFRFVGTDARLFSLSSFLFYLLSFIFSLLPIPVATRVSLVMSSNLRRRCHKRR